jgi:predicted lipoprotein with Yx(FWY)xxD motif
MDAVSLGSWSTISREDGSKQWAYRGAPVYTYVVDRPEGTTFGDGFGQVWHLARETIRLPTDARVVATNLGELLADARGFTLYFQSKEFACIKECLKTWTPFAAPFLANPLDNWSVTVRPDGIHQWAYRGRPLFLYEGDIVARETNGQGRGGLWQAMVLEPAPPLPAWVTIQGSDAGALYADARGATIYTHTLKPGACEIGDCITQEWKPVLAVAAGKSPTKADVGNALYLAAPSGSWSTTRRADGTEQWTYKGQPLFTNVNDRRPGEFRGIRYGGDRSYAAIMVNAEIMPGVKGDGSSFLQ